MHSAQLSTGPVTLYAQLASILRDRIRSAYWPTGAEIPSLEAIAAEFGVARVTARQAMQMLAAEKLVSSQRGRRTYVIFEPTPQDKSPLFVTADLLTSGTPDYAIKILSREQVPESYVGSTFVGRAKGAYTRLRKIDFERGSPYCLSTHFIVEKLFARFAGSENDIKIARLVKDKGGHLFTSCRERTTVGAADLEEAQYLNCPPLAPVARVSRAFLDKNHVLVYYGIVTFRADHYAVERDITSLVRG